LLKDEEIYNVFDTATKILARPRRASRGQPWGASGIAWWINSHLQLPREAQVDKRTARSLRSLAG
jgi:hypothetical protein